MKSDADLPNVKQCSFEETRWDCISSETPNQESMRTVLIMEIFLHLLNNTYNVQHELVHTIFDCTYSKLSIVCSKFSTPFSELSKLTYYLQPIL